MDRNYNLKYTLMKNMLILGSIALIFLSSCNDKSKSNAVLNVKLTDSPADFEEVLIDVQKVEINYSGGNDSSSWMTLENTNAGVYNLLDFSNGLDTVLVEQELPAGHILQMRLVLGDNNQVKKNGVYYDLKTPSSQQSGLKFNIHADLVAGVTYKMWIDFDAGRSIVEKGNGNYSLKPVIRTYAEATSGAISGVIDPASAKPHIQAVSQNNDTLGTIADTVSGRFLIGGVSEGTYKLDVKPVSGYQTLSIDNVEVTTGMSTNVDTLRISSVN